MMMITPKSPREKILIQLPKQLVSNLDWRVVALILLPLSLVVFLSLSSLSSTATTLTSPPYSTPLNRTSNLVPGKSAPSILTPPVPLPKLGPRARDDQNSSEPEAIIQLKRSRMAVCLVGGARRFELTGPSIVENILKVYPNSDLFLHSPLDSKAFKFSLLKDAPRIASVRIFEPKQIPQTKSQVRVLAATGSPNGVQGLLQYFNLVEGCLTMIKAYQDQKNFTYNWIVRTRVDGYWSDSLAPESFVPGQYLVPSGSSYGGLNDRLGIGNLSTSTVALSRLSLIPQLDSAGFRKLNSEAAFRAQLTSQGVSYVTKRVPFCVVSDRRYNFPPARGVPVAAMSSPGPLSGAKCRPCTAACSGPCVAKVMVRLDRGWSWTDWANGTLQLCDAHAKWENGWERVFDGTAGKKLVEVRNRVTALKLRKCMDDFEEMKRRTVHWDVPPAATICGLGLGPE